MSGVRTIGATTAASSTGPSVQSSSTGTLGTPTAPTAAQTAALQSGLTSIFTPAIKGGISKGAIAIDLATDLQNSGLFTTGEISAITQQLEYMNGTSPGFQEQGDNGPGLFIAAWTSAATQALQTFLNEQPASPPVQTPPSSTSTGTSTPTPPPTSTTSLSTPSNVTAPLPSSTVTTVSTTTTPGNTTTTTTSPSSGTTPVNLTTLLPWLSSLIGGASGSTSGGVSSGSTADLAGTDQPISALGALQPIGTPTSTSTSTSTTGTDTLPWIIGGVVAVGAGIYLWYRHKRAQARSQPGPTP